MGLQAVCKLVSPLILLLLAVPHPALCLANSYFSQNLRKEDYSRLIQDIKNSPISKDKIPPKINKFIPFAQAGIVGLSPRDVNEAVHVDLTLYPVDIRRLDPLQQVLEMNTFIRLRWTDLDLAWNSSDYGGVEVVEIPSSTLWIPTLSVLNGVEDNEISAPASVPLILTKNGSVHYSFSVSLKTSCPLDLRFFPFDRQTCEVFIYSIKQTGGHVTPTQEKQENMMGAFDAGGEWTLLSIKQMRVKGVLHLKDFNNTQIILNLQRKTTFYTVSVVLPMGLFSFMNCLVFLIPPESGEKISFLVSIFISNAIFANFINGNMPRGLGDEMPLVMDFLAFMWTWSVVAFLGTIYVIKKFRDEQQCVVKRQEARRNTLFEKASSFAGLLDMESDRKSFMMLEPGLIKQTLAAPTTDASMDELSQISALANARMSSLELPTSNPTKVSFDEGVSSLNTLSATKVNVAGVTGTNALAVKELALATSKVSFKEDSVSADKLAVNESSLSFKGVPDTDKLTVGASKVSFKEGAPNKLSVPNDAASGDRMNIKFAPLLESPGVKKPSAIKANVTEDSSPGVKKPSAIKVNVTEDSFYETKPAITKTILFTENMSSFESVPLQFCGRKCPQWVSICHNKLKKLDIRKWSARDLDRTFFCLGFLSVTIVEITVFVYYELYHTEVKQN